MIPHLDLEALVRAVGYLGLFAIVFAETGLLVGFLLPGDSLLFTAGLLASQGVLSIGVLVPVLIVAAIAGDSTGYAIGRRFGRGLFVRDEGRFFRRSHVVRSEAFFARHGGRAVVLARFVPVVRTFVPVIAGVGAMDYPRFVAYNVVGGILWAGGVTLAGYALGATVPGIERWLTPIVLAIVVASLVPVALELWRERRASPSAARHRTE